MQTITFDRVTKTYSGRTGCACGCNGKYTIPGHVSIEQANKETGWAAYDESDVSDRRAKIALKKINDAIEKYGPMAKLDSRGNYEFYGLNTDADRVWFYYSDSFVAMELNNRATTVYFSK